MFLLSKNNLFDNKQYACISIVAFNVILVTDSHRFTSLYCGIMNVFAFRRTIVPRLTSDFCFSFTHQQIAAYEYQKNVNSINRIPAPYLTDTALLFHKPNERRERNVFHWLRPKYTMTRIMEGIHKMLFTNIQNILEYLKSHFISSFSC